MCKVWWKLIGSRKEDANVKSFKDNNGYRLCKIIITKDRKYCYDLNYNSNFWWRFMLLFLWKWMLVIVPCIFFSLGLKSDIFFSSSPKYTFRGPVLFSSFVWSFRLSKISVEVNGVYWYQCCYRTFFHSKLICFRYMMHDNKRYVA